MPKSEMQMDSLAGRVIVVTGAGGGIGRAAVLELARRGAKIVVADLDAKAASRTVECVTELGMGATADFFQVDVTNEVSVDRMVSSAVERYGRIDGAINAAGVEGERAPLHQSSAANFDRVVGTNLRGTFLCMRAEIAQMISQPPPAAPATRSDAPIDRNNYCVVNVASTAGQARPPRATSASEDCHSATPPLHRRLGWPSSARTVRPSMA